MFEKCTTELIKTNFTHTFRLKIQHKNHRNFQTKFTGKNTCSSKLKEFDDREVMPVSNRITVLQHTLRQTEDEFIVTSSANCEAIGSFRTETFN